MHVDFTTDTRTFLGLYEIELNRHFRRFCRKGVRCFDVGGRVGYDALVMAKLGGEVASFEGDADAIALMRLNLQLNPELEPRVEPVATMVGERGRSGFTALDDWAAQAGHFVPDLVKVDVDGGELEVLHGATEILRRRRPQVILETHSPELEDQCGHVLAGLGYSLTIVHQRRILKELRPIDHNRWLVAEGKPA